ncbi:9498_t:CDS:2 [Cetraspora pellucida]|uniref:9498_t:CDS:1 n=1 Tax=Cetraspora pellucida TaxID=1433469 RepID=A0A9N9N7J0_9GLOM|nr:9498_t:CDS:2 [Cetraspora pellucida]
MDSEMQNICLAISNNKSESSEITIANESVKIITSNESIGTIVNKGSEVTIINKKYKKSKPEL